MSLRDSERDMLRFFDKREIGELDKRCWLIKTRKVRLNLGQLLQLRREELVTVEWRDTREEDRKEVEAWAREEDIKEVEAWAEMEESIDRRMGRRRRGGPSFS